MEVIKNYDTFDFQAYFQSVTDADIKNSLNRDHLDYKDLLNLLSGRAQD
ncbi:MAG: 2-iminoacetate synthase ThiH, partial [Desulfobacteraceae bacterium]|nr:2-iminoacetate synthase ThiH [Desulfobacteraceae bacterium]